MKMPVGSAISVLIVLGLAANLGANLGVHAAPFQGSYSTNTKLRNFFREMNLEKEVSREIYTIIYSAATLSQSFICIPQVAEKENEAAIIRSDVPIIEISYKDGDYFEGDLAISSRLIESFYGEPARQESAYVRVCCGVVVSCS